MRCRVDFRTLSVQAQIRVGGEIVRSISLFDNPCSSVKENGKFVQRSGYFISVRVVDGGISRSFLRARVEQDRVEIMLVVRVDDERMNRICNLAERVFRDPGVLLGIEYVSGVDVDAIDPAEPKEYGLDEVVLFAKAGDGSRFFEDGLVSPAELAVPAE